MGTITTFDLDRFTRAAEEPARLCSRSGTSNKP